MSASRSAILKSVTPPVGSTTNSTCRRAGSRSAASERDFSYFLDAICLPRLCGSSGILDAGNCPDAKNVEDLPGYRDDMM